MQGRPHKASDGTISYPKRGWEPPPIPDGYQRKSTNLKSSDAWIFIPILPPCQHRTVVVETGHCGAQAYKYSCRDVRLYDLSRCGRCDARD